VPKAQAKSIVREEGPGWNTPGPSFLFEKPKRRGGKGGRGGRGGRGGKRHGTGGGAFLAKIATWVFSSNSTPVNLPESFKKSLGVI